MKNLRKNLSVAFCYDDSLDKQDGVSQYVKTVGAWLSAQGHEVIYLVGETKLKSWKGAPVYSLSKNLAVNFNGNRVNTPLPASRRQISRILANRQIDILHVQVPYSPLMAGRVMRKLSKSSTVVGTFHIYPSGTLARLGTRLLGLLCRHSLRYFSTMVSVSPAAASFAKWSFGVTTVPSSNVIELSKYHHHLGKKNGNKIVFLGRLVERKGCMELLKAFVLLKPDMPHVTLSIGGDGPLRPKLESFVKKHGLQTDVNFLGFVSEKDKPRLLASADIACFPSLYGESFGIVLIEAMASGAGVVLGGNNPGYASVLGKNSPTLFDPSDTKIFAATIAKFLNDRTLATKTHEWQAQRVKNYDVEIVGYKLLEVYRQAIAKRTKTSDN